MPPPPSSDEPLLNAWVRRRDEEAFRALAEKYTALVFGAALRKTGRADWAEEVTQEVFVIFARRAPGLNGDGGLAGWLHRTAVLTAATRLRAESRRDQRMQKIAALSSPEDHAPPLGQVSDRDWAQLLPWLDDALAALPELDRRVILEHYFERKTYAEVAAHAGLTLEAARKRGLRALEKLQRRLRRRGADLPVAVLGGGLAAAFRQSAPAALAVQSGAAGIAAVAGYAASGGTISLLSLITMKITLLSSAAVVLLAGSTIMFWPKGSDSRMTVTGRPAAVLSTNPQTDQLPPISASFTAKTNPFSPQGSTVSRAVVPPVVPAPTSPRSPQAVDVDPALKQLFLNHPRTKLAEKRVNVLKKGFKSLLDRSMIGISSITNQINEAKKTESDASLSPAVQTALKTRVGVLSAQLDERKEGLEKFRSHAEAWLQTEVAIQRASILEQIKNANGALPETKTEDEGIVVSGASYTKLKESNAFLEAENYLAALESYKSLAGNTTGKMRDVAYWNAMLCGMITQNQVEVDAASARLVREASPGAACFALAAQAIQRNEWEDAQIWVNQAHESGDPTENHSFQEGFARLGWLESAGDSHLIPPPPKQ